MTLPQQDNVHLNVTTTAQQRTRSELGFENMPLGMQSPEQANSRGPRDGHDGGSGWGWAMMTEVCGFFVVTPAFCSKTLVTVTPC